jgi:hypothetical protein
MVERVIEILRLFRLGNERAGWALKPRPASSRYAARQTQRAVLFDACRVGAFQMMLWDRRFFRCNRQSHRRSLPTPFFVGRSALSFRAKAVGERPRHVDPVCGKWIRARYKASLDEIRTRYDRWQTIGPPEIRGSMPVTMFTPFGDRTEPPPEFGPSLDGLERFLARLFLRRYITWCARRRRIAAMQGAARCTSKSSDRALLRALETKTPPRGQSRLLSRVRRSVQLAATLVSIGAIDRVQ